MTSDNQKTELCKLLKQAIEKDISFDFIEYRHKSAEKALSYLADNFNDLLFPDNHIQHDNSEKKPKKIELIQLQKILGITQSTLSNVKNYDSEDEKKNSRINAAYLYILAEHFNVSIDFLMGRTNVKDAHRTKSFDEMPEHEQRLTKSYDILKTLSLENFPYPIEQTVYHLRFWKGTIYPTDNGYLHALIDEWRMTCSPNMNKKDREKFINVMRDKINQFTAESITQAISGFEEQLGIYEQRTDEGILWP